MSALQIALYLFIPIALEFAAKKYSVIHKIGVVTLCYVLGLVLANLPFLTINKDIANYFIEGTVTLAIPMLLFKTDLSLIRSAGRNITVAFVCVVVSMIVASIAVTLAYGDKLSDGWIMGGMVTGVYTGGTLNMSAIGVALGAGENTFVLLNAADLLFGGMLLLFFLTLAYRVYSLFLKQNPLHTGQSMRDIEQDQLSFKQSPLVVLVTIVVIGAALGLSYLITGKIDTVAVLLGLTTLGLVASTIKSINKLQGSYIMGNYLLYVFCVAVGSLANVREIFTTGPLVLGYVGIIILVMMLLYSLMVFLARIDVDSAILASVAGLYGPAFIPPVARAIGAMYMIPLGIAFSLIGFAVGNYLGIAVARLLQNLLT